MKTQNQNQNTDLTQSKIHSGDIDKESHFVIPSLERDYEKYFKKITDLKAGDVIVRKSCKLCNHPLRAEAEQKWEQTKGGGHMGSYTMVQRHINAMVPEGEARFSIQNITNHISHHYEQQMKRMWLREYGGKLKEIMDAKIQKDEQFEVMIQAVQLKLFETFSNPNLEPHKQVDMISKLTKTILDISVVQAKLKGDIDTIDIYKRNFQKIVVNFISDLPQENQKEMLEKIDKVKGEMSLLDG